MRIVWLAAVASALLLAGAACGGGGDEASGDTVTATDTTGDTSDETTTDETTTEDETTDATGGLDFASEDCQELVAAYVAIAQAFASPSGGASDVGEQAEIFQRFADRVPERIRPDVQTLADAYTSYADVIADAGLEPGEIPSADQAQQIQQALSSVASADVAAAGERVSTWTQQNC